uniref:Putative lysosomal acid lipase/cholesteryl ester hydrolase n=1 Tax=Serinus canaria TaxID=9135 RepID=A0A8C9MLG5_SERCA
MAMYDLPAMVGFILMQTEQEQLFYVGHAQGSSLGFIAFSSLPHLAGKIKLFFALAPVYTFRHARGPVLKLAFLPDLLLKVQEGFVGVYNINIAERMLSERMLEVFCLDGFSSFPPHLENPFFFLVFKCCWKLVKEVESKPRDERDFSAAAPRCPKRCLCLGGADPGFYLD